MTYTNVFSLLGGLGLFLLGMHMMSESLENVAGSSMQKILEKITSNRFIGVLVGALITAVIQSSSATTVMVVGFVNSGMMTLNQAVWIIMGANIGTTITGQLIALNINEIAPLFVFAGVVMMNFFDNKKLNHIGGILAGLGILFIGMQTMSDAMVPLRNYEPFINLISTFENPIVGLLVGMVFTAIIQSSSASVGVLQALAKSGIITLNSAIFVLFGQNIGTCITAVLASIGTKRNAKRATLLHLSFNIIGTIIFMVIALNFPLVELIQSMTSSVSSQIANAHTIFNIATTLILLPFGNKLVKLVEKIMPVEETENERRYTMYLNSNELSGAPGFIETTQITKEIGRMYDMALDSFDKATDAVIYVTTKDEDEVENNEKYINYLNKQIIKACSDMDLDVDMQLSADLFKISEMVERIGDHLTNLIEFAGQVQTTDADLSIQAVTELTILKEVIGASMERLKVDEIDLDFFTENEEMVDHLITSYRNNEIDRLKRDDIDEEACVIYSEMLTELERIADHVYSIAKVLSKRQLSLN